MGDQITTVYTLENETPRTSKDGKVRCLPVADSTGHRTPQGDARSKATEKETPLTANQGARMRHFVKGGQLFSLPRFPLPAVLRGNPDFWKLSDRVKLSMPSILTVANLTVAEVGPMTILSLDSLRIIINMLSGSNGWSPGPSIKFKLGLPQG